MAKKRSKKGTQQKRQAAAARRQQRRATRQELPLEEVQPSAPATPGDRLNATFAEIGHVLDTKPFAARGVAVVIDYLLAGILSMLPMVTAFNMVGGQSMSSLVDLLEAGVGVAGLAGVVAAALLVSYAYYVLVPYKLLPGQTPGKYLTHQEIVMLDGSPATLSALSIRWAVMTFVETICTFPSAIVLQFVGLALGDGVATAYQTVGMIATAVTVFLVWWKTPARRALHDIVAGTWVYGNSR